MSKLTQIGLIILGISQIMKDKRGRRFKQLEVAPLYEGGMLSNDTRKRNVWEEFEDEQGRQFDGDRLFYNAEEGKKVAGEIKIVETEPYYIESENGTSSHPETGNPANKVEQATYVVFDNETVDQLLNQDGRVRKGEGDGIHQQDTQQPASPVIDEELEEEDEEVELS